MGGGPGQPRAHLLGGGGGRGRPARPGPGGAPAGRGPAGARSPPERGRAAAERLNVTRSYDSLDDLLADPLVSVVHLASPNALHFGQCKKVLSAGKHVVCEKPLALTSAETAELVRLAEGSPSL